MLHRTFTAGALALAATGSASAALTFFTNEADFLAALSSFQTDTFSVADQLIEPGMPAAGDLLTISANGSDNAFDDAGIFGGELNLAVENAAHQSYTISGLDGATAFGATFTSPQSSQGFLLEFGDDVMSLNGLWDAPFGTSFLGWISDGPAVDEFRFINNSGFEAVTLDNAHFGVPAPGAAALLGLSGLAAAGRRR